MCYIYLSAAPACGEVGSHQQLIGCLKYFCFTLSYLKIHLGFYLSVTSFYSHRCYEKVCKVTDTFLLQEIFRTWRDVKPGSDEKHWDGNKLDGGATLRVKNDGARIWPGLTFSFQYQLVLFGWETSDESSRKTPKLNGEHVWPGIMVIKNCYANQERQ